MRASLDDLMAMDPPVDGGGLVLWHGQPGTGKTFALRAQAWSWRRWAEFSYIAHPEVFLGSESGYLLDVALTPARHDMDSWRVLVLEDTGEMLTSDAKQAVGQALSRLLNLADGLLGQGLRIIVLLTTNEPVERVHPAVARPGRCLAKIGFAPFPDQQAREWIHSRMQSVGELPKGSRSLAELFAFVEGRGGECEPQRRVGFAAP